MSGSKAMWSAVAATPLWLSRRNSQRADTRSLIGARGASQGEGVPRVKPSLALRARWLANTLRRHYIPELKME
jgi:hypothetical protein